MSEQPTRVYIASSWSAQNSDITIWGVYSSVERALAADTAARARRGLGARVFLHCVDHSDDTEWWECDEPGGDAGDIVEPYDLDSEPAK